MKNQKLSTHIISGIYKGKRIELPSLNVTRSSKARLKESFFNVLQFDVMDTIFIEAFAGSGSIGLEAISREASKAYFIEKDKASYTTLVKNCKSIDSKKCQTFLGDTFKELPLILNTLKNASNEIIVYIDPPFDYREGMQAIYDKCFEMVEQINNDNIMLICFEHMSELTMPQTLGKFECTKTKKFGNSSLSYYKTK
ncbi:MAG: 16S rRNA (guanine(966)-N(2))-methyltransferase RsmD [Arcobacteraceae bacterium]